jgi:hypothetical protein
VAAIRAELSAKRFYAVNIFLFIAFAAWTALMLLLSDRYGSWGLIVIASVPLLASVLFLNLVFSVFNTIKTLFLVYPIMEFTAKILNLDFDEFRREVIDYNNRMTMKEIKRSRGSVRSYNGEDILLILPHCIQNSECLYKVTWDKLENCRKCCRCDIPAFLKLKDKYGVSIVVASGGTAAREIIRQERPEIIMAVACETDLISGLRDVKDIPIIGILNKRDNGPCKDTFVDMGVIKSFLEQIIK